MLPTRSLLLLAVACGPQSAWPIQSTLSRGLYLLPGARGRVRDGKRAPGTLILVRNGLPDWPIEDEQFIGWADPDLSEEGQLQVRSAARLLVESGHTVDTVYTSHSKRAIRTVWIILHELERIYLPVAKTWRLSAQRLGALTGLTVEDAVRLYGERDVLRWRTDLHERPPPRRLARPGAPYSAPRERDFGFLRTELDVLEAESKADALLRCEPAWRSIRKQLADGKNVLVVGHQLSLSALIQHVEDLTLEQAASVMQLPRGCPVTYSFERLKGGRLQALPPDPSHASIGAAHSVEPAGLPARPRIVPRLGEFLASPEDLERLALQQHPLRDSPTCITAGAFGPEVCGTEPTGGEESGQRAPELAAAPEGAGRGGRGDKQVVVVIRHGKTEHNKLGLFTGWEDVPLAPEGAREAMAAGRLLAEHGVQFDMVYASWLSRSISTAWLVLEQLDALWLPITKSWRLNERMYGALTSLSKRMIRTKYGPEQFQRWRRGYSTRPPPVSSFSPMYPGNDDRYVTYVDDVRNSVRESVIRSIEAGRLELHPKLPKAESLRDCKERTIPFWRDVIVPQAIDQGKNVLIASSENAIRGLMMHLCDIPPEKIVGVEIPTGVPLVYDVRSKCLRLLDDGSGETDPLARYDFGSNGHLLFQPCVPSYDDP